MPGGKAHGPNRDYQLLCQQIILQLRSQENLVPYAGDGIDVPIACAGTVVTFDIALKKPHGDLVVVECKRWNSSVEQGKLFEFWGKVELLRLAFGVDVAGIFMTKTDFQSGAENAALSPAMAIEIAVCDEQIPENYDIVFKGYSHVREEVLKRLAAGRSIESSIPHSATVGFSIGRNREVLPLGDATQD